MTLENQLRASGPASLRLEPAQTLAGRSRLDATVHINVRVAMEPLPRSSQNLPCVSTPSFIPSFCLLLYQHALSTPATSHLLLLLLLLLPDTSATFRLSSDPPRARLKLERTYLLSDRAEQATAVQHLLRQVLPTA